MSGLTSARRPSLVSALFVLILLAVLVGLGVWQLQRLKWKEALLAHFAALKTAPARPLEDVLRGGDVDFVRVSFDCPDLMARPRLRLYGVQDGQAGYRMMTACPAVAGEASSLLVDLGFAPDRSATEAAACRQDRPAGLLSGPAVGVLRRPDKPNFVTPPNQPAQNLWYWRDLPAMARALGAGPPAEAFVALKSAPGEAVQACPLIRAALPGEIANNHLQYALTWFGLAAALACVYVAMLFGRRPD